MIAVRRMTEDDIPFALYILKESPEASMWSGDTLRDSAVRGFALAAEIEGSLAGILIGRAAGDEFEILNLAVAVEHRRRGVATALVKAALEYARKKGAIQTFLEVRASNEGGIALYAGFGFKPLGRRPNYYRHPIEDAVLLVLHNAETNVQASII